MDFVQLFDILLNVDHYLGVVIAQYGVWVYLVLFLIVFSETGLVIFPFLPGDSLLFIAGALCAEGSMNVSLLVCILSAAAILGNTINYWVGCWLGERALTRDYRFIDRHALYKTHAFYERHGGKTLVLARFIPIVRTFAPFVAGISKMTATKFQMFNVLGALLWVIGLIFSGYFFGNLPFVRNHLNTIALVGVATAVLPLILGALWKFYKRLRFKNT